MWHTRSLNQFTWSVNDGRRRRWNSRRDFCTSCREKFHKCLIETPRNCNCTFRNISTNFRKLFIKMLLLKETDPVLRSTENVTINTLKTAPCQRFTVHSTVGWFTNHCVSNRFSFSAPPASHSLLSFSLFLLDLSSYLAATPKSPLFPACVLFNLMFIPTLLLQMRCCSLSLPQPVWVERPPAKIV